MKNEGVLLMTRAKGTGTVGGKEAAEGERMGEINA